MTKGTHLLRSALLALLALAVISGGSFAAGDLFDNSYNDCPTKTRLRDGEIADLTVTRDSDEEGEVNVSWSATDPATWGLGPNAYRTSLVVLLDDGSDELHDSTLSLGTRKETFESVATGVAVTVQMAIVVDTADGNYLISDILEATINQSLTAPAFSTGWNRITGTGEPTSVAAGDPTTHDGWQLSTASIDAGKMYYVGYNQNFANYKSDDSRLETNPETSRLRIGLAHQVETETQRDDVDFEAYVIRITDEDGDVVSEGDDVATLASARNYGSITFLWDQDGDGTPEADSEIETFNNWLVVSGVFGSETANPFNDGLIAAANNYALSNVRINNDGVSPAMHTATLGDAHTDGTAATNGVQPTGGASWIGVRSLVTNTATAPADPALYYTGTIGTVIGTVYAMPPDEHRDFPVDTLSTDTTYTIEAWAINDDDEIISPTATLEVRPHDTARSVADPSTTSFNDYLGGVTTAGVFNYITSAFTVHE